MVVIATPYFRVARAPLHPRTSAAPTPIYRCCFAPGKRRGPRWRPSCQSSRCRLRQHCGTTTRRYTSTNSSKSRRRGRRNINPAYLVPWRRLRSPRNSSITRQAHRDSLTITTPTVNLGHIKTSDHRALRAKCRHPRQASRLETFIHSSACRRDCQPTHRLAAGSTRRQWTQSMNEERTSNNLKTKAVMARDMAMSSTLCIRTTLREEHHPQGNSNIIRHRRLHILTSIHIIRCRRSRSPYLGIRTSMVPHCHTLFRSTSNPWTTSHRCGGQ
mmetsp:Transcript_2928/g.9777  ORF Transcript_2928/g.9777 Transcript_2928/m.9777 type:complete len:272 (+) Transcript_2928:1983-2798(+)